MKALLVTGAIWLGSVPVLAKYLPLPFVGVHALLTFAGATLWLRGGPSLSRRKDLELTAVLYGLLIAAFLAVYPLAQSGRFGGGSDRSDAITVATRALLDGRYPYYERTVFDNPISPLPGALLIAFPFALAKAVPLQSLVWLGLWWLLLGNRGRAFSSLALLTLGSPAVLHDVVTGGDLVANAVYVLAAVLAVTEGPDRLRWPSYVFAGIAFSSRPTFWLLLLPLAVHLFKSGRRPKEAIAAIVLVSATVTLPFYFWDPSAFSPLHVAGKLAGARALLPGGDFALIAAAVALVAFASRTVDERVESLLWVGSFALWLPPVLGSVAMWLLSDSRWPELLYFALPAAPWVLARPRTGTVS